MKTLIATLLLAAVGIRGVAENHHDAHLQHLYAINTMVGTDMANTSSAGIFGKGSEEHGQTLPAVLVPNGQNFWTPQTQDTEQKCIAPYYYKDTHLQGFRNSHWIVGGCTQDYGSFTIATIAGKLRLSPTQRATPFTHTEEESHPHYYRVHLPNEQLTTEMTALSHTSMFRITTDKDQPVHIVLNTNSDEQLGHIEIDTLHHLIYASNPVHRIYQGWGDSAGFAGHIVMQYSATPIDCGISNDGVAWLTFNARRGQSLILTTASSFTGKEGAMHNLEVEMASCHTDFDMMKHLCAEEWIKRLHTIDIDDDNQSSINQFYGALYRASFLPHEMSDCDGTYPRFNDGTPINNRRKTYGDFSMWDIYRALLPLYNIICPDMAADMMQSLVNMYEEGGWLPIFPCWNSYTAAMIGDHCSVALADAYIKGIRNFDYEKAYEGMRKNAFESPESFEDYKNGMGRRALNSYLKYGYIPIEDEVKEAFHNNEQTSRTLEYAFDDFAVAQMAHLLGKKADYLHLMQRSRNWRNVINPHSGYADGRYTDGSWENNIDHTHRKSYITEGATCHYTWYVPHDIKGLKRHIGRKRFLNNLDTLFDKGYYWHGNEPCHQIAYLYNYTTTPEKTSQRVCNILQTEYNDTPGGLSGNDDAGQMSAWYIFSALGFYPVCPATPYYEIGKPQFNKVTINFNDGQCCIIERTKNGIAINGKELKRHKLHHQQIVTSGENRR